MGIAVKVLPNHAGYETPGGRRLRGITSILDAAGIMYELDGNGFATTDKGDRVHQAVHFDCENDLDESTVLPEEMGYIQAARKARREMAFEIIGAEHPIGNEALGYATRIDLFCLWQKKPTVVNWKTGPTIYRFWAVQSALEALLFTPDPVQRLTIQLQADGHYRPHLHTDRKDFDVARAALTVAAWQKGGTA